jgi:tetratricopeptide (TPR) repeat protein
LSQPDQPAFALWRGLRDGDHRTVTLPSTSRRTAGLALVACAWIAFPMACAAAQSPARSEVRISVRSESPRTSPAGNYLAARHASAQRDAAAAAAYYRAALRTDPKNTDLLERAFISVLAEGNIDEAVRLAERVLAANKNDRVARLVMGARGIKQKQYAAARQNLAASVRGPVTDLTAALLTAWTYQGSNDSKSAVETIDKVTGADWYGVFKDLHAGLILDLAGNRKDAGKRLERAYKADNKALRVVEAYGGHLSRVGTPEQALAIYQPFNEALPRHPLVVDEMTRLKRGEKLPLIVDSAQAGAAEVLYGLGASLGRRGGEDLGLVYLQLALYLVPQHPLALLSLADLYENMKKPQLAIDTYEKVPTSSPLYRNAEIQLAMNLDTLDRTDEAKKRLHKLIEQRPKDLEAIMALGNILRARKDYAECAEAYSRGIAQLTENERANWVMYYFRGICLERSKKWPAAEADLKKALELFPDQPHVLNYLGYSWVDQGINLEDGMRMIRRAVEQRPDDGYIVDSLGWAYYRIGNYDEATKHLERAVELRPEDPTINDHLGDAYWRMGRTLEATFQWTHARDLKPEPEELAKIQEKLRSGLPPEETTTAEKTKKGNGG